MSALCAELFFFSAHLIVHCLLLWFFFPQRYRFGYPSDSQLSSPLLLSRLTFLMSCYGNDHIPLFPLSWTVFPFFLLRVTRMKDSSPFRTRLRPEYFRAFCLSKPVDSPRPIFDFFFFQNREPPPPTVEPRIFHPPHVR